MTQIEALQRLRALKLPGFETRDAAALLGVTPGNANVIMRRLADRGFLTHLSRGRWLMSDTADRYLVPEMISAPSPAYVSLQSALYLHGLIEQIPAVIYAVTLGRPRRVKTPLVTVSFHQFPPHLFTGFDVSQTGAKIATPEKALFDVLYLAPGKSRLFAHLPELEVGRRFRWDVLKGYAALVTSLIRREFVLAKINELSKP